MEKTCSVEIRETNGKPRLVGTLITEGHAASEIREVVAPGATSWPEDGVAILLQHFAPAEARAIPVREPNGAIRVSVAATAGMVQAVRDGKDAMSIEFHALREHRTKGGIRQLDRIFVDAATLTDRPEYTASSAEIRSRRRKARLWL